MVRCLPRQRARGDLVDHEALGAALESGHLAGAALDVLPNEPPRREEPALAFLRTILNPHAAWYSDEAFKLAIRFRHVISLAP